MTKHATARQTNVHGIGVTNVQSSVDVSRPLQPAAPVPDRDHVSKHAVAGLPVDDRTLRTAAPSHAAQLVNDELRHRDICARDIHLRLETVDEQNRSVEAVIATEAPTTVFDMRSFRIVDEVLLMRGFEAPRNNQVPLLESHARWSTDFVHGSIRDMHVEGDKLVGRLHFANDEDSQRKWEKVRDGHITDISSGNRQLESVEIPAGQSRVISGRRFEATDKPLQVALRWTTREGSLVAIGADPNATTRHDGTQHSERGFQEQEPRHMNKTLRTYLESLELRKEATEAEAWAYLGQLEGDEKKRADEIRGGDKPGVPAIVNLPPRTEAPRTEPALAPIPAPQGGTHSEPDEASTQRAVADERNRIQEIQALRGPHTPDEVIERAISGDSASGLQPMTVVEAKAAILTAERQAMPAPVGGSFNIHAHGNGANENTRSVARRIFHAPTMRGLDFTQQESTRAQMCIAMRLMLDQGMEDHLLADDKDPDAVRTELDRLAEQSDRYRGIALPDVCREALRIGGERAPYGMDDCFEMLQRSATSTSALTNIFSAVVNKKLLVAYQDATDTTLGWVVENDNPNFKSNERHRMGKTAGLEKIGRGGTAKDANYDDEKEEYKIARYAKKFAVDEQDIIDDDMNAIMRIPEDMGLAAAQLRPDLVYAILLASANLADGTALFASGHNNVTTAALARTAIEAAVASMGKQRIVGRPLNIRPRFLLVPQDLEDVAVQLIRSREIREGGGGGSDEVLTFNTVLRLNLQIRIDDRLGVAGVTDPVTGTPHVGTATNWFLTSDGSNREIEVGYRRGTNRRPIMRSFTLDKGTWGIGWDIKHDIGAKALGFRGMHRSTGAG